MGSCIRGVNTSDLQGLCQQVTTKQITTMSDWSPEYNTDYAELASGTFQGYITGTVKLVFIVFFIFGLLSVLTMMLMSYARYMARGPQNQHGFHKPPSLNHRQKLQKLQEQMGQPVESSAQSDML